MPHVSPPARMRIAAVLAAAAIQIALVALIVWGLSVRFGPGPEPSRALTTITPTIEPPPRPAERASEEGEAAPPARRAEAAPVAAPEPPVVLQTPKPAAKTPGEGEDASQGAAVLAGPGSGAGGEGSGRGSGQGGAGRGSGAVTPAVRIAGALRDRDYPREAARVGAAGTVAVSFRVGTDGRVDGCAVLRSSGHAMLDRLTCRLVEKRFRYRPARDAQDRPVESTERTTFTWGFEQR